MRSYECLSSREVISKNYSLIAIQDEHIEEIRIWRNSQMDVLRQSSLISPFQQKTYFEEKIWPDMNSLNPLNILMSFLKDGILIGYGGLVYINWIDLKAEVSFLLNPYRAKNIKIYNDDHINFLLLIKKVAFEQLKLFRLYTETYDIRRQHIKNLEAADFKKEGVMRSHVRINGSKVDSIIHGCLNEPKK